MSKMEFRVGSAPVRSSALSQGNVIVDSTSEPPLSGFLNRKCVIEAGGKKSKDRSWQTFWCQLKGVALEFHRVDGVKSEGFKPPPRDIYPPPHMAQHKAGFVSVTGAIAVDDYTSQIGKDLQKRRSWLFELTLSNKVVYLLQAPNDTQRAQWVQHIRRAASGQGDDVETRKLGAARCSVRHRSRQNVFSVTGGHSEGVDEPDIVTTVRDNPCTQMLRERLRAKKELLAKMTRMCYSFLGDTQQLYSEDVRKAPSLELPSSPRRLSLPSPVFSSITPSIQHDPRRASTISAYTTNHTHQRVRCQLLQDHILVPGASWSQLKQGDEVVLIGRLSNGWYRCLAQRAVTAHTMHGIDSVSITSHLSEISGDSGLPSSNRHSITSDILPEAPSPTPAELSASGEITEMFVSDSVIPEDTEYDNRSLSHDQTIESHDHSIESHDHEDESHEQTTVTEGSSPHIMRVGRSYSYITATQTNPESSLFGIHHPRRSLDASVFKRRGFESGTQQETDDKHRSVVRLQSLLSHVTESHTDSYRFPLVGVIPASIVEKVPEMADLPLVTPPVFTQSPSHSACSAVSPSHSLSQLNTPQHSIGHPQSNGHITNTTHHSVTTPTHFPGPIRKTSASAPTTPLHAPTTSALSPVSHVEAQGNNVLSPTKSPRSRRRSHEPVTAMLELGPANSLIKRLLPRNFKKPYKQNSLPEKTSIARTPTIEEELQISPSPSPIPPSPPRSPLPPPAMLDFNEREFETDMRTRMSSASGRPIRSTGICLTFGEDESSSESDTESSTELESHDNLVLSQSLPSTGSGFHGSLPSFSTCLTSALLLPPPISPDIMAPGNLRRAASAHGTLNVNTPEPTISPESRSKSGSAHSLTSSIVRGLHNSFKRHNVSSEDESAAIPKKRGSSKKRRTASTNERVEPTSPKFGGIFRQPPTGQKRFVYLDPRQPKYGFRLESYGRPSELGQEMRVFVQSVGPGSPAFMSGLYPGDTILEVNGVNVRTDPVAAVVKKIQDVPRKSDNKVQLTVMFADGVTRLEKMKTTDHLRYQMKMKQAQLRVMISEEVSHMTDRVITTPPPPSQVSSSCLATDIQPWSHHIPPTGPAPHIYSYDSGLNEQISLCCHQPSELTCDVLVLPLCLDLYQTNHNILTKVILEGGSDLVDELCLASYCPLGENIITKGYNLPAHNVYHCVFGNLEENLQKCIWRALDEGCSEREVSTAIITFWLDGFTAINVSPHCIIEFVRLWLQQGGNRHKYMRIIFSAATNPDFATSLVERYFPLAHYYFKSGTPGNIKQMHDVTSQDVKEKINDSEKNSHKDISDAISMSSETNTSQQDEPSPPLPSLLDTSHDQDTVTNSSPSRTLNPQRLESDV